MASAFGEQQSLTERSAKETFLGASRLVRFHSLLTLAANQMHIEFGPCVGATFGAGVPSLAGGLRLAKSLVAPSFYIERTDAPLHQFGANAIEPATLFDAVADCLSDLRAAGLPGVGRDQADRFHHRGPLPVVIAGPRWLAEVVLFEMHHFVDEGGKNFLDGALKKL